MRKICTLICAGVISFTGFTVQAQISENMDSVIQSLALGQSLNIDNIIGDLTRSLTDTTGPAVPQTSAIEGPLVIGTVVPEVNQTIADILIGDDRTGRYAPKLKINFTEYPLRSLMAANTANNSTVNGRNGRSAGSTDALVLRIQNRLRLPQISLVVHNRTATVSGTVETERQRSLVESMLRFEPGIDVVKNEITVVP